MFTMRILFKELIEELIKWLKKMWCDAKLKARLDKIERDYKIKFEKDLKDSFTPIFEQKEHKKTTIKARKLVREMSLRAKWLKNFKD